LSNPCSKDEAELFKIIVSLDSSCVKNLRGKNLIYYIIIIYSNVLITEICKTNVYHIQFYHSLLLLNRHIVKFFLSAINK